jgi:hypothetical protein
VTSSAPSFLRSLLILPSLLLFMALGLEAALTWAEKHLSPRWPAPALGLLLIILAGRDMAAYQQTWARAPEVLAIYRADLAALAGELRAGPDDLAGVSTADPGLLDPLVYEFSGGPGRVRVMWFDGRTNMLVSNTPRPLYVSPLSPISPAHAPWLGENLGTDFRAPLLSEGGALAFDHYQIGVRGGPLGEILAAAARQPVYLSPPPPYPSDQLADWGIPTQFPVNFGGVLAFLGYEMPRQYVPDRDNGVDDGLNLQLYLQPLQAEVPQNLSLFVHFVDWGGNVAAGRDFLGAPAPYWQTEFIIVQDHYVGNFQLAARPYFVSLGLYNTDTGERYPVLGPGGEVLGDRVILAQLEVR